MRGDANDGGDGIMLSRRDAIRGGAALGTLALASRIGAYAQVVEAQITEPRIQLGSDYAIHDNGGNLVINHDPNGDILDYDATADQITTLKPLTSVTADEVNGIIIQGSSETVQAAVNRASAGDMVLLQAGTFTESVDILTDNITIRGRGRGTLIDGGTDGTALDGLSGSTGTGVRIENLAVQTTPGAGNVVHGIAVDTGGGAQWHISNVWVEQSDQHGIAIAGLNDDNQCIVTDIWCNSGSIDNDDIFVNSDNNLIDSIIGTVNDSGTGNTVGDTV